MDRKLGKYDIEALQEHKKNHGKIEIAVKADLRSKHALSVWYTPGVAQPCREISSDIGKVYDYTIKGNTIAVATDGSRVLGLGNIGAEASIPVMEGKCALFREYGGVDAFPLCLNVRSNEEFVQTMKAVEPILGGVNLEDIQIPNCFEIEASLKTDLNIPVFHDDQHGTAVVVLAALENALKLQNRKIENLKIVISGAGAAGSAIGKLLVAAGAQNIIMCDRGGAVYEGRGTHWMPYMDDLVKITNKDNFKGSLKEALFGADVFIGAACPGLIDRHDIAKMNKNPICFPLSNPDPDIEPEEAKAGGAAIVGTGRSDLPNQINNLLAFPGIMRGALDSRARHINEEMKTAAAKAIANLLPENELNPGNIIVEPFRQGVATAVSKAVAKAAFESKVARIDVTLEEVYKIIDERLKGK
jgi:malate dehydrogenase (oxaloacetate-decarboxylating)